jgi:hypothetical protein
MGTSYNADGYDGSSLVEFPNQPVRSRRNGSREAKYKYWCQTELAHDGTGGLIPERFAEKVVDGVTLYLVDFQTRELSTPLMSEVLLTYNQSAHVAQPIYSDGDIEKRTEYILLVKTRISASESAETGHGETEESTPVYGLRYEYTETKNNYDWTHDNITKNIQKTGSVDWTCAKIGDPPTGLTGVPGDQMANWVFRGTTLSETPRQATDTGTTPAITTITEVWEWSPFGWEGAIDVS